MEQTPNKQWNFAALTAFFVIFSLNVISGGAVWLGKLTIQEYLAAVAPVNALVLGWVGRILTTSSS